MDYNKNEAKRKQEDIALNRALIWFAAAMVLEFLLLLVNKYYVNFSTESSAIALALMLDKVIRVTAVLGVVAAAVCGVWVWKRAKAQNALPFLPLVLCVVLLAIGVGSGLVVLFQRNAMQLLHVVVPAGAVLALVYYLYQREFFISACGTGVGLLGLWLVRKNTGAHNMLVNLYLVAGALVLLAVMLFVVQLKKNGGEFQWKDKRYSILPKQSNFSLILLSCLVSLLAMLAGLLLGGSVAFYLMFVLLAWLFVLLVYYTVKMM